MPPNRAGADRLPICVEQGRWAPRGKEDHAVPERPRGDPSREELHAWRRRRAEPAAGSSRGEADGFGRPRSTTGLCPALARVRARPRASSARSGTRSLPPRRSSPTASTPPSPRQQSASSLQLSLENEKLKEAAPPTSRRSRRGEKEADVVGYVVAINGKLSVGQRRPVHRPVPEDVGEATRCRRHRGDRARSAARSQPPQPSRRYLPPRPSSSPPPRRASPTSARLAPACVRRCATPTSRSTMRRAAPTASGSTAATSQSNAERRRNDTCQERSAPPSLLEAGAFL